MDLGTVIIGGIILFFIILGAVSLAISPLVNKEDDSDTKTALSFMRDKGILHNKEYKDIIRTYQNKSEIESNRTQFSKHSKVLNELREIGKLTEAEYDSKIDKLRAHFKIT